MPRRPPPPVPAGVDAPQPRGRIDQPTVASPLVPAGQRVQAIPNAPPRIPAPPVPSGVNAPPPTGRSLSLQAKATSSDRPPSESGAGRPPPAVPAGVNAPQPTGRAVQAMPAGARPPGSTPVAGPSGMRAPPVPVGVNAPQPNGRSLPPASAAVRGETARHVAVALPCFCGGDHGRRPAGSIAQAMFKKSTIGGMDEDVEETPMTEWAEGKYTFTLPPYGLRNQPFGTNTSNTDEMLKNALAAVNNMYDLISNGSKFYLQGDAKPEGTVLDKVTYHVARFEGRSAGFNCYATTYETGADAIVITSNTQKLNNKLQEFMDEVQKQTGVAVSFSSECHEGIHAEIQQYINTLGFESSSLGIQKLCCFFCAALLLAGGVPILGSHGKTYGGYRIPKGILTLPKLRARLFGGDVADYYIGLTEDAQNQFLGFVVGVGCRSDLKGSARSMPKLTGVRTMTNTSVIDEFTDKYL